jgi:hypothetical protein
MTDARGGMTSACSTKRYHKVLGTQYLTYSVLKKNTEQLRHSVLSTRYSLLPMTAFQ